MMQRFQNGLVLTGAYLILILVVFLGGPELAANNWTNLVKGIIILSIVIYLSWSIKKATSGPLPFKSIFIQLFTAVFTLSVLATLFDYIVFFTFDSSFMPQVQELVLDKLYDNPWMQNMSDEQMEKIEQETIKGFESGATFKGLSLSFVSRLVFWTVVSLILAAIFKKKEPEFGQQ